MLFSCFELGQRPEPKVWLHEQAIDITLETYLRTCVYGNTPSVGLHLNGTDENLIRRYTQREYAENLSRCVNQEDFFSQEIFSKKLNI